MWRHTWATKKICDAIRAHARFTSAGARARLTLVRDEICFSAFWPHAHHTHMIAGFCVVFFWADFVVCLSSAVWPCAASAKVQSSRDTPHRSQKIRMEGVFREITRYTHVCIIAYKYGVCWCYVGVSYCISNKAPEQYMMMRSKSSITNHGRSLSCGSNESSSIMRRRRCLHWAGLFHSARAILHLIGNGASCFKQLALYFTSSVCNNNVRARCVICTRWMVCEMWFG